jgi:hypothetical protein
MKSSSSLIAILLLVLSASAVSAAPNTWTKKSYEAKGTWEITDGQIKLIDFSTKKAPDLKIFLSPHPLEIITNKNAINGAKLISKLESHKGDQTYTIPDDVDPSKYKTIIIHCEKYTKLWCGAAL